MPGDSTPSGMCQEDRLGSVDTASGEWRFRHSAGQVTSFFYGNGATTGRDLLDDEGGIMFFDVDYRVAENSIRIGG